MFGARQSRLPKLLMTAFRDPGLPSGKNLELGVSMLGMPLFSRRPPCDHLRLPRDLEEVVLTILPNGTQAQKDCLCRMCGREAVAQVVRRWRGSFLRSEAQLLEWVSRGTVRRWAREDPEPKPRPRTR
jgi:hypothetical protein